MKLIGGKTVSGLIILLAGGTGFSYVHSIASAIAQSGVNRPVQLYWGLRNQQALYAEAELTQLASGQSSLPITTGGTGTG